MLYDSHRTNPSSSMVGTRPFGFMARYSGVRLPPNGPPTSTRSNGSPSSAHVQRTFMTLLELVRPQTLSIEGDPLTASIRRRLPAADTDRQRPSADPALRPALERERVHPSTEHSPHQPVWERKAQMRV